MFQSTFIPVGDSLSARTASAGLGRATSCAPLRAGLRAGVLALAVSLGGLTVSSTVSAAEPRRPECVAPAKPGGGFDLTCRLTQTSLKEGGVLKRPMRIVYMPGGVGAVAYNNIVAQRPDEGGAIVAFSGGSLLNLAQGKFGRYSVDDVRWLAAIGADYGVVVVRDDSTYKTLGALMDALKKDPAAVVFGTGGSVGSQDIEWPIIRGFYMGPKVSDEDYQWWQQALEKTMQTEGFTKLRAQQGLYPFSMTGKELDAYVKARVKEYADLAKSFGLVQEP